jgi:S1-C subfamily serine protease
MEELARLRPGDRVTLDIVRYGQRMRKTVELGEFENAAPRVAQRSPRARSQELLGFSAMQITPQLAQRMGVSANTTGVIVHEVDQFSPAAGYLVPGTQIISINGRAVNSVQDVERVAEGLKAGQVVSLVVRSGDAQPRIVNYRVR